MKDPRLAAALLESSPDALAELFDAYGDRLFRYCWGMLRSRELAQVVLRDTLLVAQAHIARLADPEDPASLAPWLYSLARGECRRHQAVPPADADESPARLGLAAADAHRVRAGPGQPPQLRRRAESRAERDAAGAGQPGLGRGQHGHLLPGQRLGHGGRPGHLVSPAGRFRFLVAPAPVAARAVAVVGLDVRHPRSEPGLVRAGPLSVRAALS